VGVNEQKVQIALAGRASFAHAHHIEYNVGVAYALLGKHDEAVEWLRQAAVNGFLCTPYYERDDFLRDLRSHPEFRDLLDWLRAENTACARRSSRSIPGGPQKTVVKPRKSPPRIQRRQS
jgi:hypothetical protein